MPTGKGGKPWPRVEADFVGSRGTNGTLWFRGKPCLSMKADFGNPRRGQLRTGGLR
jgi:hypothetical protein